MMFQSIYEKLEISFKIINRMTRSENMLENNNQIDLKFW